MNNTTKFRTWAAERQLGDREIAEMVGLHRSRITRVRLGHRPSPGLAVRLEKATRGAVKAVDWNWPGGRHGHSD